MLSTTNLSARFGPQVLFENVTLQFDPGKRYGLVGANGSGKSTFLKILTGEEPLQDGSISVPKSMTVGYLRQDHFRFENFRVVDVVIMGNQKLWSAINEKNKIMNDGNHTSDTGIRLAKLEDIISAEEGYSAEARACKLLTGLGISDEKHFELLSKLSGGYKLRVLLAQVLFGNPDIMLLDEPTNHLDIISISWLQNYLTSEFRGLLILISHDRQFLNGVCTHIADVDYDTIMLYTGNYEGFYDAKMLAMEQRMRETKNSEKKVAELEAFITRFKAKASKARQAQSRVKQLEKIEIPEIKQTSRRFPNFNFSQRRNSGEIVLRADQLAKSFGEKKVFQNVSFEVLRGEKIAIVGANGTGKSTLLKILAENLPPDKGSFQWGIETYISYFAQDHHSQLHEKKSVYDWLYDHFPDKTIGQIRGTLAQVLFDADDIKKSILNLSGGESARLLIARIILEQSNVLILDEPTNHLDLESITALEDALVDYPGTLLLVSHDRSFINKIVTRTIEIVDGGARFSDGNYDDLRKKFPQEGNDDSRDSSENNKASTAPNTKGRNLYMERKALKAELQKLRKQSDLGEKEIQNLESQKNEIEKQFSDGSVYNNGGKKVADLEIQKNNLQKDIDIKMKAWEKLIAEIETKEKTLAEIS